tara:strand:+ start:99 stop:263 length:165 start_codon:yes stop_codon:yes gene_type:complete
MIEPPIAHRSSVIGHRPSAIAHRPSPIAHRLVTNKVSPEFLRGFLFCFAFKETF